MVGSSGSGKSTLSNILLRLYEVEQGHVLVDGYPVQTLSAKWLLNNITVVEQQSVLFNASIKENVSLGNTVRGVPMQDIQLKESIDFALLQNIINASAKGVDSEVGPGGSRLSGGQRQRVALARAHVRNTPILILDESLSALDVRSRNKILAHIREWRRGKTTIIITHDLSQIKDEDYVYILANGKTTDHGLRGSLNHCKIFQEGYKAAEEEQDDTDDSSLVHSPFSDYFQFAPSSATKRDTIQFPINNPDHIAPPPPYGSISKITNLRHSVGYFLGINSPLSPVMSSPTVPSFPNDISSETYNTNNSIPAAALKNARYTIHGKSSNMLAVPQNPRERSFRFSVRPLSAIYPSVSVMDPRSVDRQIDLPGSSGIQLSEISSKSPYLKFQTSYGNIQRRHSSPPSPQSPKEQDFEEVIDESLRLGASAGTPMKKLGYISPENAKHLPIPTFYVMKQCYKQIKNKSLFFVGLAAAVINGGMNPIFSYAVAQIFTPMFPGQEGRGKGMYRWIILAFTITFIDSVTIYLRTHILCVIADRWVKELRMSCFESVLSRDISWYVNNNVDTGELTSLIINDTEDIRVIVTLFLTVFATCASISLICFVWVMTIGWKLCLVSFSLIPGSYVSYLLLKFFGNRYEGSVLSLSAKIDEVIHEMVSSIRTLRILGIERYFIDRFNATVDEYSLLKIKDSICKGLGFGISELFPFVCQGILLWYGMNLVAHGEYTLYEVMMIFTILLFSITSISILITAIPQMQKPLIKTIRLFHLLELSDANISHEGFGEKIKMNRTGSSIVFEDVCFSYTTPREFKREEITSEKGSISGRGAALNYKKDNSELATNRISALISTVHGNINNADYNKNTFFGMLTEKFSFLQRHGKKELLDQVLDQRATNYRIVEVPVLRNLSTTIPSNTVVAIVGPSGSGKSTLTSLLTKLYTPTSGSLTIGGIDIKDIDTDSLRNEVAVVGQMPLHFFRGSIRENLMFGIPFQVTESEMRQACQECSIDEFIVSLPDGYETVIGGSTGSVSSGATSLMSGGQMQRIGLARALLRKPRILILDECTSGLDPASTAAILKRLEMYKQQRNTTVIIITHQEETASIADIVIFVANGRVVRNETGKTVNLAEQ